MVVVSLILICSRDHDRTIVRGYVSVVVPITGKKDVITDGYFHMLSVLSIFSINI